MANVNANINVNIQTQQAAAQLRKLSADISRFNQQTFAANSAAAQQQRALNQALIDGVRTSGHFRTSIVPMTSAVEKFGTAIEKGQLSLGQYTRYAASQLPGMRRVFTREFDMINRVAESRVKKLNTQFIALGESANGMRTALAMTPTSLDQFAARSAIALQRQQIFNRLLRDGSTQLLNWGKNTQWAGRQLMVGFTIPLGLLGAQAAKVFRELEAEAINFKKVYGDMFTTDLEVEKNLAAVKELSVEMTKYGQTIQQTMQLANTAAQSGARGAELLAATTQATRLAVLGQMEQNQAIETTISLQTAFTLSNEQLAESINFLNSVENQTILSLQDVSEAIPRVASVIRGFGGDVQDLSVLLVAMKEGGVSAAEGANALKNSMARVIAPTKQAIDASSKYGISLREIVSRNEGKVVPLFQELAQALESIGGQERQEVLSAIFGKFQYARIGTLLSNIAREGSQAAKAIELTGMEARDLALTAEKELGAVEGAVSTKFTAALEKAKLALAPVGEEFLKALTPVLESVGKILDKFNELPGGIKTAIVAATGIIGGIAPIVLMVVGLVANGIANIAKFVLFLRKQIATLRGNGEQFKMYTSAELEAAAAAASLEGRTSSLTKTMVLQRPAIETLITLYNRLAASARSAAAAMPTTMGGVGLPIIGPRGGGFRSVAPPLPVAYRNAGGAIFESAKGKTRVPGSGNTDTVPAMLTPGEFVINKKATKENLPLIKAINSGDFSLKQSNSLSGEPAQGIQRANIGLLLQGLRRVSAGVRPMAASGKVFPKWFYDTSTGTNRARQKSALEDSYKLGVRIQKQDGSPYTLKEIQSMSSLEVKSIWKGIQRGHMAPSIPIGGGKDYLPGIVGPMSAGGKGGNLSIIRGGNPKEIYDMFSALEAKGIHPMSIMFGAAKDLGYKVSPSVFTKAYDDLMTNLLHRRIKFGSQESFEQWAYRILQRHLGKVQNDSGNFFERMKNIGTVRGIDPKRTKVGGKYVGGRGSLFAAMLPGFNSGGYVGSSSMYDYQYSNKFSGSKEFQRISNYQKYISARNSVKSTTSYTNKNRKIITVRPPKPKTVFDYAVPRQSRAVSVPIPTPYNERPKLPIPQDLTGRFVRDVPGTSLGSKYQYTSKPQTGIPFLDEVNRKTGLRVYTRVPAPPSILKDKYGRSISRKEYNQREQYRKLLRLETNARIRGAMRQSEMERRTKYREQAFKQFGDAAIRVTRPLHDAGKGISSRLGKYRGRAELVRDREIGETPIVQKMPDTRDPREKVKSFKVKPGETIRLPNGEMYTNDSRSTKYIPNPYYKKEPGSRWVNPKTLMPYDLGGWADAPYPNRLPTVRFGAATQDADIPALARLGVPWAQRQVDKVNRTGEYAVPGFNKGGMIPGVQYLNRAGMVLNKFLAQRNASTPATGQQTVFAVNRQNKNFFSRLTSKDDDDYVYHGGFLEEGLTATTPKTTRNVLDNLFGPGLYTSRNPERAATYTAQSKRPLTKQEAAALPINMVAKHDKLLYKIPVDREMQKNKFLDLDVRWDSSKSPVLKSIEETFLRNVRERMGIDLSDDLAKMLKGRSKIEDLGVLSKIDSQSVGAVRNRLVKTATRRVVSEKDIKRAEKEYDKIQKKFAKDYKDKDGYTDSSRPGFEERVAELKAASKRLREMDLEAAYVVETAWSDAIKSAGLYGMRHQGGLRAGKGEILHDVLIWNRNPDTIAYANKGGMIPDFDNAPRYSLGGQVALRYQKLMGSMKNFNDPQFTSPLSPFLSKLSRQPKDRDVATTLHASPLSGMKRFRISNDVSNNALDGLYGFSRARTRSHLFRSYVNPDTYKLKMRDFYNSKGEPPLPKGASFADQGAMYRIKWANPFRKPRIVDFGRDGISKKEILSLEKNLGLKLSDYGITEGTTYEQAREAILRSFMQTNTGLSPTGITINKAFSDLMRFKRTDVVKNYNTSTEPGQTIYMSKWWAPNETKLKDPLGFKKQSERQKSDLLADYNTGGFVNQPIKLNNGNIVPGVGNTDTVPAMLTPGEFVVNKQSTQENLPLLHAINDGKTQFLQQGGQTSNPYKQGFLRQIRSMNNPRLRAAFERQYLLAAIGAEAGAKATGVAGYRMPAYGHFATVDKGLKENWRLGGRNAPGMPISPVENQFQESMKSSSRNRAMFEKYLRQELGNGSKAEQKTQKIMQKLEKGQMLSAKEQAVQARVLRNRLIPAIERGEVAASAKGIKGKATVSPGLLQTARGTVASYGARESARSRLAAMNPEYRSRVVSRMLSMRAASGVGSRIGAMPTQAIPRPQAYAPRPAKTFSQATSPQALARSIKMQNPGMTSSQALAEARRQISGGAGGGGRTSTFLGMPGMPKRPGRFRQGMARANSAVGRAGMGLGMGVSMASMMPMMGADEEGKWMGMNAQGAMMGMMGAGTLLSVLPMLGKAALPVVGVAAAAAAVGFALYKWRDSVDSAARKTAEYGSNLGAAANAVSNMAAILGKQDLLKSREFQQLTVLPGEQEEFASYTQMLTQEGGQGQKFIKELQTATSEERFTKLVDYLRSGIAAELLTVEEAKLFAKAVGAELNDVMLAIRAGAAVGRQKTGASALAEIAQERETAALGEPAIVKTINSIAKDSLDASEASMTVGAGTQIIKSYNEVIAKAQEEQEKGIISFARMVEIVNDANSSIQVWEKNIKTAYANVNDFGALLQGSKIALQLAGITEEQRKGLDESYKELFQGLGSTTTAGAQRRFKTAEGELLPSLETEGAFQKVADLAAQKGFEKNIQGVGAYIQSEFFDREAFDEIAAYGKNLETLMKTDMLKIIRDQAVAQRGIDPAVATGMMNTIATNETALQAFIDGGQTVDAFINSIVSANSEIMFSSEKLQKQFLDLSEELDVSGQSEAFRAYLGAAETDQERERRLMEIQAIGSDMSPEAAQNARSQYLATRTTASQYYDPVTVDEILGTPAYQRAISRTRTVTKGPGDTVLTPIQGPSAAGGPLGIIPIELGPDAVEVTTEEFDETLEGSIREAIDRAGEAGVSGEVVTFALNVADEEGRPAGMVIDEFTNKVQDLQGLDEEVRIALGIDLGNGQDVETFGGYSEEILRNWGMLSALNPNIDLSLVARAAILDEDGNVITDPLATAKNLIAINKAYTDLEKAGGKDKKKAQVNLVKAYQVETEYIDETGEKKAITPEGIINDANKTLEGIGKSVSDLPAARASQVIQLQTALSDLTAPLREEIYLLRQEEAELIENGGVGNSPAQWARAAEIAAEIASKEGEIASLEADAAANILTVGMGQGTGNGSGSGGSQSPVQGFVENILNQFKMWVDASAKMGDLNNARTKFVDMVLKGDSIFKKLDRVKGIDPLRLQEILSMGPEGAKEFLDKYVKGDKLTKAGQGILDAAAAAGINETIGIAAIEAAQIGQQAQAAKILSRRGEGSTIIQNISGDPRRSAELIRLQKEYNKALRSGNDKEIKKAENALNSYLRSQREVVKAEKEREEAAKSAAQKAIEANNDVIEANNKFIEEGDKHFEREERRIEKKYRDQIKAAGDEIELINEQIDIVNDLIEEQEKLNRSDQNRIRDLERQKEMLNRQLEELDRANELDGRRIETLQREDEIRGRVEDALSRELELMSRAEDDIRESYEKRIEALDEVARVNQHIINQQKQQLDLSRAISEGDIYAATAAAQEMRATSAGFAVDQVRQGLETGMENQIEGLRTSEGLTREEAEERIRAIQDQSYQTSLQIRDIEDAIYSRNLQMIPIKDQIRGLDLQIRDIQDDIYDRETIILGIQTTRLEPLQTSLKNQQDILDELNKQVETEIEAIKFREMSADQWADLKFFLIDQNESLENQNTLLEEEDQRLAGISRKLNKIAKQMQQINKIAREKDENEVLEEAATAAEIKKNEALTDTERNEALRKNAAARQEARERIEEDRRRRVDALLAGAADISLFAGGLMKYAMGGIINPSRFTSNEAPPIQKRSRGGSIFGDGSRDSVAAMLTPGEFVIRKAMVDKYGIPMMEALNQGSFYVPRYDTGAGMPEIEVANNTMVSNVNAPVYNTYDMKFAINGTNQSADEIANKVMFKMTQLQNQGVRSNRGY